MTIIRQEDYVPLNEALLRIADLNGTEPDIAIYQRCNLRAVFLAEPVLSFYAGYINRMKKDKDNQVKVGDLQRSINSLPIVRNDLSPRSQHCSI